VGESGWLVLLVENNTFYEPVAAAVRLAGAVNDDAIVLVDEELVPDPPEGDFKVHALPLTRTAISLGNLRVTNVVSLGALIALGDICSLETLEAAIKRVTPVKYAQMNLDAVRAGFELVQH
jgi:2-oxoglutarate ferredoxin oxidoreductase subunit gamma